MLISLFLSQRLSYQIFYKMLFQSSFFLLSLSPALSSAGLLPSWLLIGRGSDMCAVRGRANTDNNYFWSVSKASASYSGCAARCISQERCKSFGWDESVCMLFDEQLDGSFQKDSRSALTFYDVGCISESDLPNSTPSATRVQSTFSYIHASSVQATGTRTATVSVPAFTQFGGSNGTYVNGTNVSPTSTPKSTISVVGSLISMPLASTASAATEGGSTTTGDDDDNDDEDASSDTSVGSGDEATALASTTTITLASTSSTTLTSYASSSTTFPFINGNSTLLPFNTTGPGAPLHRNGTSAPFINSTIS